MTRVREQVVLVCEGCYVDHDVDVADMGHSAVARAWVWTCPDCQWTMTVPDSDLGD